MPLLMILCTMLMVGAFAVDAALPLGVAAGLPYAGIVLIVGTNENERMIWAFAGVSCILIVLGWLISPPGGIAAVVATNRILAIGLVSLVALVESRRLRFQAQRDTALDQRNEAQAQIRMMRGLLPICAECHKIRDENGEWHPLEEYLGARSRVTFTHSYCQECTTALIDSGEHRRMG